MSDFRDQFNTALKPKEETAFQNWLTQRSQQEKRDVSKDLNDYDLLGFWKSQGTLSENNHASDQFKKPNHPTFSNQSIYSGQNNSVGGSWGVSDDGSSYFAPSKTNLEFYQPSALQRYFQKIEPDAMLAITPQNNASYNPIATRLQKLRSQ